MHKYKILALCALAIASGLGAGSNDSGNNGCCDDSCSNRTVISCHECACGKTNGTFFSLLNLPWDVGAPMRVAGDRKRIHEMDMDKRNNLEIAVFGGQSTRPGRLAAYFMPDCQEGICVGENIGDVPFGTPEDSFPCIGKTAPCQAFSGYFGVNSVDAWDDLDPDEMGLFHPGLSSFKSNIAFKPKHSFAGFAFSYRRHFKYDDEGRSWWMEIGAPIMWVKNQMNLQESDIIPGGGPLIDGAPANMTEAFANPAWKYGRIDCKCEDGKVGVADVDVRFGYEIVRHEMCHFDSYFGVLIPTGTKVKSYRLFEPVVGHNHHAGFMFGTDLGIRLWHDEERDRSLWSEITIQGLYLFRNTQTRIVPLKNRPWSQFIQVFESEAQAQALINAMNALTIPPSTTIDRLKLYLQGGTPGVNAFAQDVRVQPDFQRRINTALLFAGKGYEGEVGYNFFSRDDECVSFACKWQNEIALKNPVPLSPFSGDLSTIQLLNPDLSINDVLVCRATPVQLYQDAVINPCDLDLRAAASPGTIVHTVYFSLGYQWAEYKNPYFVGLGASYEFSRDNTGLNEWTLWGKGGINF